MGRLITGIFKSRSSAELAVEDLSRHGFAPDDISVLSSDKSRGREFVIDEHTKSPEGLALGAAIGGIIGAIIGGFMSIGLVFLPGVALFATGHAVSALAGFGAGSLIGGIIGGLLGLAVPEHEASLYKRGIRNAGILVGVYSPDIKQAEARKVMDAAGGRLVKVKKMVPESKDRDDQLPPEQYKYSA